MQTKYFRKGHMISAKGYLHLTKGHFSLWKIDKGVPPIISGFFKGFFLKLEKESFSKGLFQRNANTWTVSMLQKHQQFLQIPCNTLLFYIDKFFIDRRFFQIVLRG